MLRNLLLLLLISVSTGIFAQKKTLDYKAYDDWKTISNEKLSPKGGVLTFETKPLVGDGELSIQHFDKNVDVKLKRAEGAQVQFDEQFVAFKIVPDMTLSEI